jgi:hypothetical protein
MGDFNNWNRFEHKFIINFINLFLPLIKDARKILLEIFI